MGKKKGKSNPSTDGQAPSSQPQGSSQPQAPSQTQAPRQQQPSARGKPRPKTQDQPKQDDSKATSSSSSHQKQSGPWVAEYASLSSTSSRSQQPAVPSAWISNKPQSQPNIHPFVSQSTPSVPSAWAPKQQHDPVTKPFTQTQSQPQVSSSQQQSGRGKPRPKTQDQPTRDDSKASSSSHQEQPGAWVPEYASVWGSKQRPNDPQPKAEKPQSQQGQPRPKQQQKQQSHDVTRAATLVEDIDKLSISNVSVASSTSSQASKHSTKSQPVIPTTAIIPLTPNKGSGTRGQKVSVDVNFLPLLIDKLLPTVYQYDVTIEPNLPKRMLPHIFERYRQNNFKNIFVAFDGQKIAVSPQILPISDKIQQQTKVIDENGRERVYMVAMKEARDSKIDFQSLKNYTSMRQYDAPLRAMQMLEIVLKSPFLGKNGVQAGRSFYMCPTDRYDLGDNYELWTGLYQATVLGSRPYLNVDIAHKAFPSQLSVIDVLDRNVDIRRDLDPRNRNALQSHLNGLMIKYSMPGNVASSRSYKFLGLDQSSKIYKFKSDQDKKEYTIEQYFRSRNVAIKYPHLPTLKLGNAVKNITVPMEFCSVAGNQAVNKKCTEMQTRNMIKVAATSTDVRRDKIMDMLRRISHNQSPTLSQFGIQVGTAFTNVPARILPPPTLEYSNNKTVVPSKGQWRIDNLQFLQPMQLTRYAILIMCKNVRDVRQFCDCVHRIGRSIGMNIDPQYSTHNLDAFSRTIREDMCREMSKMIEKNIELLFVVIPDYGDTYGKVKQCAELECGILTQCIKASTLTRKGTDQSTVTNILLKVNAKLNGTNHKLAAASIPPLMKQPFMLIGADVTHPSPGQDKIPSVVGVVSSHDKHGFQYNKCWRLQDPKQEIISDFDQILKEHLEYFEKKNKILPNVILYFRDGVSEGQFQQVLTNELNAMYRGCQEYRQGYKPKITFIVVQKRHHTRFFPPPNSQLGRDDRRNNNVPPGTIVDTQITHPNETQFYLVSHQSIQGVARPTKYCLLRDDSDFPVDQLHAITYNLCHFFARCTRTVSYPAPTYYAHLAAARGRVYIEGRNIDMDRLDKEFKSRTVKTEIIKNHPMYFI